MREDVRRKSGASVAADFGSDIGTPVLVDTTRGDLSTITESGSIVVLRGMVQASASLTFGLISSNGVVSQTFTVTGAVTGKPVMVGAPAALETGLTFSGFVSAADTVKIRLHNNSGSNVTPAVATWTAAVLL